MLAEKKLQPPCHRNMLMEIFIQQAYCVKYLRPDNLGRRPMMGARLNLPAARRKQKRL